MFTWSPHLLSCRISFRGFLNWQPYLVGYWNFEACVPGSSKEQYFYCVFDKTLSSWSFECFRPFLCMFFYRVVMFFISLWCSPTYFRNVQFGFNSLPNSQIAPFSSVDGVQQHYLPCCCFLNPYLRIPEDILLTFTEGERERNILSMWQRNIDQLPPKGAPTGDQNDNHSLLVSRTMTLATNWTTWSGLFAGYKCLFLSFLCFLVQTLFFLHFSLDFVLLGSARDRRNMKFMGLLKAPTIQTNCVHFYFP